MSGRSVVGPVLLGLLGLLVTASPASAQAPARPTVLKIQAAVGSGSLMFAYNRMLAERVEKMSGGRLRLEVLPAGAIVGATEVLEATHRKVLDGASAYASYWVGKHPAAYLFFGGPGNYGLDLLDFYGWMYEGGGWELYQEYFQKVIGMNVVAFLAYSIPEQPLGWLRRPIRSLDDFKGMKFRISGMGAEGYKEIGVATVFIPGPEILPAGERGVIDGTEWVSPAEDMKMGFHNVWKHYYLRGPHELYGSGEVIFNKDVWDRLPAEFQEILRTAIKDTFWSWLVWLRKQDGDALREMQEKHGVKVFMTPPDVYAAYIASWKKILEREAVKDAFFRKVLESQRAYAAKVVPLRRVLSVPYESSADHWREYWEKK